MSKRIRNHNPFTQSNTKSYKKPKDPPPQVSVSVTPPKYGSKAALTKQTDYIIPGYRLGQGLTRRSHKREIGYPGLNVAGGYVFEEFDAKLQGDRGIQLFEEMRRNDPVVAAMLLVVEQLIQNASLMVRPSEQNPDAQESLMAADLVHTSLNDMGNTWTDTLSECLTFIPFGFSVMSVWHKQRNGYKRNKWKSSRYTDNKWGWAGISLRSQTTLDKWEIDAKGRATGMWQCGPPSYNSVLVPFTHAAHFRTRTERDNPEGVSVLRACSRAFYIKKHLEETEAIGIERDMSGLPVMIVPEGVDLWNSNDADAAATLERCENIVRLTRVDKYGGHVLPFGYELKLVTTSGQRAHNADKVIDRWDQRIAVTLLADMLLIGQQNVGSFALVQGKIKLFSSALESYAARVAGVFNRDLIPRMMILNGIAQEYWPTLKFGPVETPSLVDLGEYITALTGVGVPLDEAAALYLRQVANFPSKAELPSARAELRREMEEKKKREEEMAQAAADAAAAAKQNQNQPSNAQQPEKPKPEAKPAGDKNAPPVKKALVIQNTPIDRYSIGMDE